MEVETQPTSALPLLQAHRPAGSDGAVEPGWALPVVRLVFQWDRRDVKHRQAVVYVAFHIHLTFRLVGVHVHKPRDHIGGEGHNERLENREKTVIREKLGG